MTDSKRNVSINFEEVALKLHKLLDLFDKLKDDKVDLIFVCTGKTQNDANASSSEMFQLWLTGFQFPETLFVFSSSGTWYMLTSAKKSTYLEPIKENYQNVKIITRVPGQPDDTLLEQIFGDFKNPLVGVLDETKPLGDFADGCYKVLEDKKRRNIGRYISDMLLVRTSVELETQRQASQLACGVMKTYLINQIENILDSESKTPHSTIVASSYEFHTDEKFLEKMERRYNMNRNDMEVICSNVQSGDKFTFGIGVKPTADNLSHEPGSIIISVCTKYSELCACLTRTLLLDGTSGHKDAYRFATKVFDYTLSKLKAGTTFASVYKSVYEFVSKENKGYESNLVRSLGHTIGLEFKDSNYTVIETNERCVVENDMVFHLSVGFNELELDEGKPFAIWIADTVHVTADGANILTSFVSKSLENISYELEDEVSEGEEEERKPVVSSQILRDADSVILKERLRNRDRAGIVPGSEEHIELLSKQKDLRNKKVEEISKRFKDSGGLGDGNKEKQVIKMDKIHVFSSPELFASDIVPHKIYVDWRNEAVMLPINGYHLPFSVMIIKNVTCNSEDDSNTFTLRINFQVPGSHTYSTRGDVNPLPDLVDENSLFIKEVLYKSKDTKHIQNVFRSIKDLIKQIKQRESDDSSVVLAEQDKLQLNKTGRRIVLKDLMIRPNIHGSRRIIGFLEAHHNGLRYLVNTRDRIDNVDIAYSNIKHAIFQPCERELIVLLHFHLKSPIMVGKRKTFDIQFYCEVGTQIDDLDNRRGRSYNDPDETMEEMRERELRRKLNTDFKLFVSQLHELSKINVNLPYRDLMFTGVPLKSNVELLPTENCLVHLVEWPPFILSLNDIEIISLERIQHGLRNFDMVFINKDYSKPIKRVDLIPVEYLDNIKRWLNELEIVWYEGKNNLQWTNILKTILEDVESFIENGCFDGFLGEDETEEEDEDIGDDDEDYDAEDSDEEGEDDDDDEFEDDDESLADEDEDEEEYEEEDDEEGLSWDELEERAKEDDDNISYYDDERKPQKKQRR